MFQILYITDIEQNLIQKYFLSLAFVRKETLCWNEILT